MRSKNLKNYQIYNYKEQRISKWMIGWYKCDKCQYIHVGHNMVDPGYKCENCKTPSKGGTVFFNYDIDILIDLMQDLYNTNNQRMILSETKNNFRL